MAFRPFAGPLRVSYNMAMLELKRAARRRPLAVALIAAAIGLPLLFSSEAWPQSTDTPPPTYGDVTPDNVHRDNIAKLQAAGVFDGTECGPGQFCPHEPLKRRTFAVWMVRVLEGDQAPGFVDSDVGGQSQFADVDSSEPEALLIERLAELGVTAGCAQDPWRYCPDDSVSRSQMASFLTRAFELPEAPDANFSDVDQGNVHRDNINRLSAAGITAGCASQPKRYCPNNATTRGQMASFLSRAITWKEAQQLGEDNANPGEITITVTGTDNSIRLQAPYDEGVGRATASWQPPTNNSDQVDYYVLQWRRGWEEFGSESQQVIATDDSSGGRYSFLIPRFDVYGVRVIVVHQSGSATTTTEIKIVSQTNRFRDLIEERIINVYQDEHPWLRDAWKHINSGKLQLYVSNQAGAGKVYLGGGSHGRWAKSLGVAPVVLDYFDNYLDTTIHELAHVYTLSTGVDDDHSGPIGIGYLYFHLLDTNTPGTDSRQCLGPELYADIGRILFYDYEFDPRIGTRDGRGGYWVGCGLQLSPTEAEVVKRDALDVARAVYYEQRMPDWFYRTYQKSDGSMDLDKLWADINSHKGYSRTRTSIIYHLREEFGGFCYEDQVQQFLLDLLDEQADYPGNPWRDGGC